MLKIARRLTILLAAMALGSAPAFAGAFMPGVPAYPHAKTILNDATKNIRGYGYVLESQDSVATVDRWYRSKLPASCRRLASGPAVQYACPSPRLLLVIVPDANATAIHASVP